MFQYVELRPARAAQPGARWPLGTVATALITRTNLVAESHQEQLEDPHQLGETTCSPSRDLQTTDSASAVADSEIMLANAGCVLEKR